MSVVKLGSLILDIASGPFGSNLKVEEFVPEGFPIIDGANLKGVKLTDNITKFVSEEKAYSLERSIARRHDIVVTISGTLGQLSYIPTDSKYPEYLCSQRQFRVTFDESKVDVEFLAYYFHTPWGQQKILSFANYVGVPALSQPIPNFKNIVVDLPPINEQRKIVSALRLLDTKIENNASVISQLESLAKTIYDYWFLQFEFPNEEGKPYKSSGGKMVWCEELKREIPEGWEAKKISTLIDRDKGGDWGKEAKTGNYVEKVTCIRGADFPSAAGGELLDAPERWILSKNIGKEVAYGDIMIEISGGSPTQSTGRICYANHNFLRRTDNPIISSNFCRTISLLNPDAYSWFYVMWKSLYDIGLFFNYEGKTTGIKNLLFDTVVTNVSIPFPNNMLIDQYCEIVNNIFETIQEKSFENAQLSSLRNFLLPMLMNGQVTFKDN